MAFSFFAETHWWMFIGGTFLLCYLLSWLFGFLTQKSYSWKDRHIFVTGGSEGCGFEVAKALAQKHQPKAITLFSRSLDKLSKAKAELEKLAHGIPVNLIVGDVSKDEEVKSALFEARAKSGPVHVVLAAAGLSIPKYFEDLTPDDFKRQMDVNFNGVVNAARHYLTPQTQSEERKFIAISSVAASVPFIGYAAYAPTKVAVRAFMDVLRNEFQDVEKTSVHICFPPDMETPGFLKEQETKPVETKKVWPEAFNEVFKPEDVANQIIMDVAKQRYHVHSPDFFGNLLVSRGWGHYPRNFVLLETILAPLFVLAHEAMVWMTDRCVRKYAHHTQK
jgi:NADP-dependent 3-hydroxy acid dehydrogenase YdfG